MRYSNTFPVFVADLVALSDSGFRGFGMVRSIPTGGLPFTTWMMLKEHRCRWYFKFVYHCVKICAVYIHPFPSSFDTRCQILRRRQMQLKLHSAAAIVKRQVEPWLWQRLLKRFSDCGSLATPDRFCNFYIHYEEFLYTHLRCWTFEKFI